VRTAERNGISESGDERRNRECALDLLVVEIATPSAGVGFHETSSPVALGTMEPPGVFEKIGQCQEGMPHESLGPIEEYAGVVVDQKICGIRIEMTEGIENLRTLESRDRFFDLLAERPEFFARERRGQHRGLPAHQLRDEFDERSDGCMKLVRPQ